MSTITKQWLQQKIADMEAIRDDIPFGLGEDGTNTLAALRIALASLEAEPVAWLLSGGGAKNHVSFDSGNAYADPLREVTPLYTAPPAPVSVPNGRAITQHFDTIALETAREIMCDVNRPHEFLGGEVQLLSRIQCRIDDACRAAMLHGADGALTNEGAMPATQFKPVADLYGLTSPTGSETSFTFDAVEARDFFHGGWSVQEYVELERYQQACAGNSPAIPDGWVACSERMPEDGEKVLTSFRGGMRTAVCKVIDVLGHKIFVDELTLFNGVPADHWQPLPAVPKLE
ncbi:DUF551 domain-containing protein [Enterobacter hormaechei]|uniref:DUF551 domain-containing protein n=1 Tax=Enterobacter hormaechei TaxID=158836 RepID=UPI003906935C